MKTLCIYHGNCADGFGAAWVVRRALGEGSVEFHPGVYQEPPPDVTGRDVLIVDFSYKRPVIMAMAASARSVMVLDHHKTAAEDLDGLPAIPSLAEWQSGAFHYTGFPTAHFDMTRSGARMTWDYFNPGQTPPALIQHIEDRDLWRFALDGTREIQAVVFSHPYDFAVWDDLAIQAEIRPQIMASEGVAIERKHFKDIAELVAVCRREMVIGGVTVPVANLPYTLASDAGHSMATQHQSKIGVSYWDIPGGRVFSLRSTDDGPDVSAIAKAYGGGGHAHAAGFRVGLGWEGG